MSIEKQEENVGFIARLFGGSKSKARPKMISDSEDSKESVDSALNGGFVKRSALRAAEGITPDKVVTKRFSPTKFREGYSPDAVDEFLDVVVQELRRLEKEGSNLRNGKVSSTSTSFLTPEDAVNSRFKPSKFREGYDQDEVDDYIDLIVVELRRLTAENAALRRNPPLPAT